MEASAAATIAGLYDIPFVSIRIISNNILNDGAYALSVAETCQDHVLRVVESFLARKNSLDSIASRAK